MTKSEEEVRRLLRVFIPDMGVEVNPELSRGQRLTNLVREGLYRTSWAPHLTALNTAIRGCGHGFILNRMKCETDEEEQEAKMEFAQDVIEEYLEILEDRKSGKSSRERTYRRLRIEKRSKSQEFNEPFRFKGVIENWMNPENLKAPEPKSKAKAKANQEAVAA